MSEKEGANMVAYKECTFCVKGGLCSHKDAPTPWHSKCIGKERCGSWKDGIEAKVPGPGAVPIGYELAKAVTLLSATWLGNGSLKVNEDDYLEIKRLASDFLAKAEGK